MEKIKLKKCSVSIDKEPFSFEVEGEFFYGKNEILFNKNESIINGTEWESEGYKILKVFSENDFKNLKKSVVSNIVFAMQKAGISVDKDDFELEEYHKYVTTKEAHLKVIDYTRNLRIEHFDLDFNSLERLFSDAVNTPIGLFIKKLKRSHIQIRISRPNSLDINPPHRDGYLSYWENILNVWVPIVGCNEKSSLPIISMSHFIPENKILKTKSKGASINGNIYHVPCIIDIKDKPIEMTRPNPKEGEVLMFTPFLIHGAAVNKNVEVTRVALELRLDKK